jgi:hypothetical protein
MLDGALYPSVENAYQAAKTSEGNRGNFIQCSAGQAKRYGRSVQLRQDWEDIKLRVMTDLVRQKFMSGTPLAEKLLATGNCQLVEGNYWNDTYWGVCRGVGKNHLGKILMVQRKLLQGNKPHGQQVKT